MRKVNIKAEKQSEFFSERWVDGTRSTLCNFDKKIEICVLASLGDFCKAYTLDT